MQATLPTHRVETTIGDNGTLTLDHLPFQAGQSVEVIILPHADSLKQENPYPLRGTPVRYDNPLEPVASDDWHALQ